MSRPAGLPPGPGPAFTQPAARRRRSWRHALGHSLKWRLVLLFLLLALGTTGLFVYASRAFFATGWRELARPLVVDYIDRLAAEIGSPPDVARAQALARRLPLSVRIDGPQVQWASHPQHAEHGPRPGGEPDSGLRSLLVRSTADGHRIRFGVGDWQGDEAPRWPGWGVLAGLLALTALAYGTVRRLLRPLDDIRAGALRYGAGDFSQPIALRRRDELGDLASQVNGMASGLQRMLEGQRGLLLAISHELRSPLTRARLHAELLADSEQRQALLRDLGQMRDLVSDLLESERLAGGAGALQREPTDLNALVRQAVAATGRDVVLALDGSLPLLALDRSRLALLLRNLLDNAQRHGGGTPVTVSTTRTDTAVCLTVRDHGPGVADAQLPHLAQAFYRPDSAHARSAGGVGGVGLGLYLCRLVALSHGGELQMRNAGPGLAVSLLLPRP